MLVPAVNPLPSLRDLPVHLLGIRGRGMEPLALAARSVGADVDGCDGMPGTSGDRLSRAGIDVVDHHDAGHVAGRRLVVTTFARPSLAEVGAAAASGTLHHRTDLLNAVTTGRVTTAVTGTHGKGTVAAFIGAALVALDLDPMVVLGVSARPFDGPFRSGGGPAVVEADDADGTIARIRADVSVVTNSWSDHPMLGRSRREVLDAIAQHVARVPLDGRVVLGRAKNLEPVAAVARAPVWRLGRDFDVETVSISPRGRVVRFLGPNGVVTDAELRIHGGCVADNAALAFAVLRNAGVADADAADALGALDGLERRVAFVGEIAGVRVFDDYGKHPEAMLASLDALRALRPRRLHVVYEPNLHADVLRWRRRWAAVLGTADSIVVLPVNYTAPLPVTRRAPNDWPLRAGLAAELAEERDD
jgi:UDP-N-acetylmuramate--alanine ligase